MSWRERKDARTRHYFAHVYGRKLVTCLGCNGSGHYDADGAPPCSSCNGSGKTRGDAPLNLITLRRAVEELRAKGPPPCRVLNEPVEVVAARIMARAEETGTDPLAVARVYMRPDPKLRVVVPSMNCEEDRIDISGARGQPDYKSLTPWKLGPKI